ncbi:MAG TPA: ATP-binding protein [Actinomycetota bacterium]
MDEAPQAEASPDGSVGGIEELIALAKERGLYQETSRGITRTWVFGHETTSVRLDRVGEKYGKGQRHIARDFIIEDQVIGLCGEEGSGKSWCAYQIAGELTYPDGTGNGLVLGTFELERPLSSVMIIDFEQPEQDIALIRDDMVRRGVLDPTRIQLLSVVGAVLDRGEDAERIMAEVLAYSPEYLIFDTATEAVAKPREDESVKPLFTFLDVVKRGTSVRGALLLLEPRKRISGDFAGRQFDDLFGSRMWKGRPSAVLHLTKTRLTVWKQRGGYLTKRWGTTPTSRFPWGAVERVGETSLDGPPTLVGPPLDDEDAKAAQEERRDRDILQALLQVLERHPGSFGKDALARQVKGYRITEVRRVRDQAISDGLIRPADGGEGRGGALIATPDAPE